MDLEWILAVTAVSAYAVIGLGYLFWTVSKASREWESVSTLYSEKKNHV